MTLPIPANQEAVTTCQLLCVVEDYCKYWRYDSDTQNCDLLKYPYLPSCGSVTAGARPDFAECLSQDSGTCDDIVKENCELQGDILWQDPAVRDAYECQEFLQLLGPVYGGEVFSYSSVDQVCYILDTEDSDCKVVSGPRMPSVDQCSGSTDTTPMVTTPKPCTVPSCDSHAEIVNSPSTCGHCQCLPGWAGPGTLCGPDNDYDGWSDVALNCTEVSCTQDNCVGVPNSGQEDADGDGVGDACDVDSDNDGWNDDYDNCPLVPNQDQSDIDDDSVGDACDNCPEDSNQYQEDGDNDDLGDACDDDIDNDGIINTEDNCPEFENPQQIDTDSDGVGDECDSCPEDYNPDQEDANHNNIGDVCDDGIDTDHDGVPDNHDNCPNIANADQLDSDGDGIGDVCDNDSDNDGIEDNLDNCPIVPNTDQLDSNNNGIGDACENDCDGDSIPDAIDVCPCNNYIYKTDFRGIQNITLGENSDGQDPPVWEFRDDGREIIQKFNSAPGIAIGGDMLAGVEFEGTIFVNPDCNAPIASSSCPDDDWIGSIFSFQVFVIL